MAALANGVSWRGLHGATPDMIGAKPATAVHLATLGATLSAASRAAGNRGRISETMRDTHASRHVSRYESRRRTSDCTTQRVEIIDEHNQWTAKKGNEQNDQRDGYIGRIKQVHGQ